MAGSPRDELLKLAAQNVRMVSRLDDETVKTIIIAYEQARRELLELITERRNALYTGTYAGDKETRLRELAHDVELFNQVEARMKALQTDVLRLARGSFTDAERLASDEMRAEVDVLMAGLDLGLYFKNLTQVDYASVEIGIEDALRTMDQSLSSTAALFRTELRNGLIQGESFDDLIKRLLARDASVFTRGEVSAELGVRRTVITANNAARNEVYQMWGEAIPGLGKQAVAAIDEQTTDCCLRVHGQVQPLDKPFVLEGQPRFAARMMYPAFHWRCRTTSVAYHPDFEQGSRVSTQDMVGAATAELTAREDGSREKIHPAHATSRRGLGIASPRKKRSARNDRGEGK